MLEGDMNRLTIVLFLLTTLSLGCGKSQEEIQNSKMDQASKEHAVLFNAFASRFNAVTHWDKGIGCDSTTYSYQIALTKTPLIAFDAQMSDIILESDQAVGHFWTLDGVPTILRLHLRLDKSGVDVANKIKKDSDFCFIVARNLQTRVVTNPNSSVEIVADGDCVAIEKQ
jgi:hypothetical protein